MFVRVTLKWTYLIWLTDSSLGNQHYHATPISKLRSWTSGFFKIKGFVGRRFLSSLPLPLLALFCARPNFRTFKKRKMLQTCGKPYGLATQASGQGFPNEYKLTLLILNKTKPLCIFFTEKCSCEKLAKMNKLTNLCLWTLGAKGLLTTWWIHVL